MGCHVITRLVLVALNSRAGIVKRRAILAHIISPIGHRVIIRYRKIPLKSQLVDPLNLVSPE